MKFEKKVLVAGCGKSGLAAARLLLEKKASIILYDGKEDTDEKQIRESLGLSMEDKRVELMFGDFLKEAVIGQISLAVLSPGIPVDVPFVLDLQAAGIAVWGEVELAFQLGKGRIAAITGTNGKTTTTTLAGEMMKDYYKEVYVVGNIGNPYTLEASKMTEEAVTVAEISSFQLETIQDFKPEVSAILNITPDHLNRHHTMENYIKAKLDITKNQDSSQVCVLNYDDIETRSLAERVPARTVFFSRLAKLADGICLQGEDIVCMTDGKAEKIIGKKELLIPGDHNVENAMAAIAIGLAMGVPKESLAETLRHFHAVEHRIEFVAEKAGVVYYNDSKATNTDAAIKGIMAMDRKTVLIGGGYDKKSEYDSWVKAFDGKVKALVLIGQTREKIAETARRFGVEDIAFAETLKEAVELCAKKAEPGDAVLLSPACASWGMFKDYEQRGQLFKDYVKEL